MSLDMRMPARAADMPAFAGFMRGFIATRR